MTSDVAAMTATPTATESRPRPYGLFPQLALFAALGLLLIALSDSAAREGRSWAPVAFWIGLLTIIVPIAGRLLGRSAGDRERLGLVLLAALALYAVKILDSPASFTFFDEFAHWATLNDIVTTGHLFTPNNILPASPLYPGLEIVTSPLVNFGWDPWTAGVVVLGITRVLFGLVLFLLFGRVSGSARIAGVATLVYMANPSFLFFDSQFAYESLTLPLAVFVLWLVVRRERVPDRGRVPLTLAILVGIVAAVVSHHITSIALAGFLVVWAVVAWLVRHRSPSRGLGITGPALIAVAATVGWTLYVATVTVGYLAPAFEGAFGQVLSLIAGEADTRVLFQTASGLAAPAWEQYAGYASVLLILLALPYGIWAIWRRNGFDPAALTLALAALLYPASLVARLTSSGAELAQRSQEFLFLGVGFAVAYLAVALTDEAVRHRSLAFGARLLPAGVAVLFVGGIIVGVPFWARMPGPYLVEADQRSVEPQSIDAAMWTAANLPPAPDARFLADRDNRLMLKTYGQQHPITASGDEIDVKSVYFSTFLSGSDVRLLARGEVRYVLADQRLTTGPPTVGVYVERGEITDSDILPVTALDKWNDPRGIDRIFDSGDIRIYDILRLTTSEPR